MAQEELIYSLLDNILAPAETESNDYSGAEMTPHQQKLCLSINQPINQNFFETTLLDEPEYLDDSNVWAQQPPIQESMETAPTIPTANNLQQQFGDEDSSLLGMILMDIDNDVDIEKAEDAHGQQAAHGQQDRSDDELIGQHCNLDCTICGAKSSTFQQVMRHYQSQHGITGHITCCGERYEDRCNLLDHVILQNNPAAFTCSKCSQSCHSTIAYQAHLSSHTPPDGTHQDVNIDGDKENFVCELCTKSFATKSSVKRHYKNIHGPMQYKCEICSESYTSRFSYLVHKRENHSQTQCSICEKRLTSTAGLRKHMVQHKPNKEPVVCDICGKTSKHSQALQYHKRFVHAKKKEFKCSMCEKAFVRKRALEEHEAVHTGKIMCKCSFCSRTFKCFSNMYAHQKNQHPAEWLELSKQSNDPFHAMSNN